MYNKDVTGIDFFLKYITLMVLGTRHFRYKLCFGWNKSRRRVSKTACICSCFQDTFNIFYVFPFRPRSPSKSTSSSIASNGSGKLSESEDGSNVTPGKILYTLDGKNTQSQSCIHSSLSLLPPPNSDLLITSTTC